MLGLAVVAVRAAASYLLVAAATVVAVAALSLVERAGSSALPVLHGPTLTALLAGAVPAASMVALTLSAPTVRLPLLNLLIAVALVLLAAELLPQDGQRGATTDSTGATVAPANLVYRAEGGTQALVTGPELAQQLRHGDTIRPGASLWLPPRATPVAPREPLRHRADVDVQVVADGLRTVDGEMVAPAAVGLPPASPAERLPGARAWQAERLLDDVTTLAGASAARGTLAGRAITAFGVALLFFAVRLVLRASYWLAANLLFAVVAIRVLPGIIVTASDSVIPDLVGLLPLGLAERLADHAIAAGAIAVAIPLLIGELLFAPASGRSLADLRAGGSRGRSTVAPGRSRARSAQPGAAAAAAATADLATGDPDLTDLSDATESLDAPQAGFSELADVDRTGPEQAESAPSTDDLGDLEFGDDELDIDLGDDLEDGPEGNLS